MFISYRFGGKNQLQYDCDFGLWFLNGSSEYYKGNPSVLLRAGKVTKSILIEHKCNVCDERYIAEVDQYRCDNCIEEGYYND